MKFVVFSVCFFVFACIMVFFAVKKIDLLAWLGVLGGLWASSIAARLALEDYRLNWQYTHKIYFIGVSSIIFICGCGFGFLLIKYLDAKWLTLTFWILWIGIVFMRRKK